MEGSLTCQLTVPGPDSSTTPERMRFEFTFALLFDEAVIILTAGATAAITRTTVDATARRESRDTVTTKVDSVPADPGPAILVNLFGIQAGAMTENSQVWLYTGIL